METRLQNLTLSLSTRLRQKLDRKCVMSTRFKNIIFYQRKGSLFSLPHNNPDLYTLIDFSPNLSLIWRKSTQLQGW